MTYTTPTPPKPANGHADTSPALGGFLDRFLGTEKSVALKDSLAERAGEARDALATTRTQVTTAAKAHPLLTIAAIVGGIAAIGLLANPKTRRAAMVGGAGLWSKYGHRLTKR